MPGGSGPTPGTGAADTIQPHGGQRTAWLDLVLQVGGEEGDMTKACRGKGTWP